MSLDEYERLALVGFAHCLAGFNSLRESRFQVVGLRDARAVAAAATEIRQTVAPGLLQTVLRLRDHLRERVLPCSFRARNNHGMREAVAGKHFANASNCF